MKRKLVALAMGVLAGCVLLMLYGCDRRNAQTQPLSFATPDEAVAALVASVEKNDTSQLRRVLGVSTDELIASGDDVADRAERASFLQRYAEQHQLVAGGPDDLILQVGRDDWPLPIPLVREGERWRFDGEAGLDELLVRRIGSNELRTIDVMRGYVEAQRDYAAQAHDGSAAGLYAPKLRSAPGKQDGLYWEAAEGERESPAGPFLAAATAEGYETAQETAYHGYLYRVLTAQGAAANGGERNYMVDGKLSGGFALVAWPATYDVSGIMTFMVNQDGVIWQRDLGERTAQIAAAMSEFDPDENWTPLAPETAPDEQNAVGRANPASEN